MASETEWLIHDVGVVLGTLKGEILKCDDDDREWTSDAGNGVSAEGALAAIDTAITRIEAMIVEFEDA